MRSGRRKDLETMELQVRGGAAYAYTAGRPLDPARPSIVFAHSAGADHSSVLLQSRYFAYHGWIALALDLPAHGRSAGPALCSIAAMADWVAAFMAAAGATDAVVVGHSMGSLVALDCAARYPERVRALALIGTSVPMPVSDPLLDAARADRHAALDMLTLWGHSSGAQRGANAVPGMWMTGTYVRLLERTVPGVVYTDLRACHDYVDGAIAAVKVRCPTLF